MEQIQNSSLNLMQMVTAQKADTGQSKGEVSGKDDFRKLLEQCGGETEQPVDVPAEPQTQQKPTAEQPEPDAAELIVSQVPADLPPCPEKDEEELVQLQELAAMQVLFAEQRIVTAPEAIQNTAAQTVSVVETAEQNVPVVQTENTSTAQTENTSTVQTAEKSIPAGQTEQSAQVVSEVAPRPVEAAAKPSEASRQDGGELDLREQGDMTGETRYDLPEESETVKIAEAPVFGSVETAPVKVGETAAPAAAAQPEPVEHQLADKLTETISAGETRVELQLTPESLGKVTIELTQKEDGSLHIALQAESSQTRSLLERDLSGLQSLLSQTTRQEVEVNVAQPQEQQQQQSYDGHQGRQQQQQQRENPRNSSEDFLNQLRLGLLIPEAEAS